MNLNKGISTPIAIVIIVVIAALVGGVVWYYYSKLPGTKLPIIKPPEAKEEVNISTDKTEYEHGDKVKAIIQNNLDKPIFLDNCSPLVIETKEQLKWKELFPTRCETLFILINRQIKSGETKIWKEYDTGAEWQGKKMFPTGLYRIKFTYFEDCTSTEVDSCSDYKMIYSNKFKIKEKIK